MAHTWTLDEQNELTPADVARRIAFVLYRSQRALGIKPDPRVTIAAQMDDVLEAAMAAPHLIDPNSYRLIYMMRFPDSQPRT